MAADGAEDALERLARNRRIDAVLILAQPDASEIARLLREEDPGAPPLFAPTAAGAIEGVRGLSGLAGAELVEELLRVLGPE